MGQGGRGMNSLMLNAESGVDLKEHVGHKVEVTGTIAGGGRRGGMAGSTTAGDTTTGSSTTAGATTTGGGASTGQSGRGMRSMTVTSLKMVSDSCS